jgi:hypothetical protein
MALRIIEIYLFGGGGKMKRRRIVVLSLFFSLFISTGSQSLHASDECEPPGQFPYKQGWLGGDGAYSIPLSDGRTLWLFGDTFISDNPNQREGRIVSAFIRSTIGISTCDPDFDMAYYWRQMYSPHPKPFFHLTDDKDTWYWPTDGFEYHGKIYVTLTEHRIDPDGPPGLNFTVSGVVLAIIQNTKENPAQWTIEYKRLSDNPYASPGTTIARDGEFLYFFSVLHNGTHDIMITRIPVSSIDDPQGSVAYLDKGGKWRKGFNRKNFDMNTAKILFQKGSTEMTVRYHGLLNKWLALYSKNFSEVCIRTADQVWGPWSKERIIFKMPEFKTIEHSVCYAGKEHIEYSGEYQEDLVFTYACNFLIPDSIPEAQRNAELEKSFQNMDMYVPKTVILSLYDLFNFK